MNPKQLICEYLERFLKQINNLARSENNARHKKPEERTPLEQTAYILARFLSVPVLWDRLCNATEEGKPSCLNSIISITSEAGLIETQQSASEHPSNSSGSFCIYSEHHECTGELGLQSDTALKLSIIIWSLEGKMFKVM